MKNTLIIIGISLLVMTGVVKLINESLKEELKENFDSYSRVHTSSIVETESAIKTTEPIIKEKLNFYSNEYISFYYPKNWDIIQNKLPVGYSIKLHSNEFCENLIMISLVILDGDISENHALNSVLKGFLKEFEDYKIHNSTKTLFKGNISVYKRIDITQPLVNLFGEVYAFRKNDNTFVLIKMSDNENGLNVNFSNFENSFEILTYKNENKRTSNENINSLEKLAQEGDKVYQTFLGYAYLTGDGAPINYERAFYWNKKLAESGYAGAMYLLGQQYKDGLGTMKDVTKGEYWIKEAKKNGFEE